MYLIKGDFNDEEITRHNIREREVSRILHNLENMLTPSEYKTAEPIINWLRLRDVRHHERAHFIANPGEPVEAFEERIRISQEMADIFPQHRVGTCANIWLWLKLGAPGESVGGEADTEPGSGYQSE